MAYFLGTSLCVCCYVLDIKPSPLTRFACFPYAARVNQYQAYPTDLSRINWPWTVEVKALGPRACMPGLDEPACWLSEASLMTLLVSLSDPLWVRGPKEG